MELCFRPTKNRKKSFVCYKSVLENNAVSVYFFGKYPTVLCSTLAERFHSLMDDIIETCIFRLQLN